jgi:hypothetical protein
MLATAARCRYAPTVDRLTPIVMAICRSHTLRACFSLDTSRMAETKKNALAAFDVLVETWAVGG